MPNNHSGFHKAYEVEIKGNKILVDCGIIDLVLWLNQIPGVETFTSCQGGSASCRQEAFLGFTSIDPNRPKEILKFLGFGRLSEHNSGYELEFDVPDLIALNQKHFAEFGHWKNAFDNQPGMMP
jgi:hypothetical protein